MLPWPQPVAVRRHDQNVSRACPDCPLSPQPLRDRSSLAI